MRCDPLPRSLFGEVGAAIPFSVRTVTGEGGVVLECPDNGLERWVATSSRWKRFSISGCELLSPSSLPTKADLAASLLRGSPSHFQCQTSEHSIPTFRDSIMMYSEGLSQGPQESEQGANAALTELEKVLLLLLGEENRLILLFRA